MMKKLIMIGLVLLTVVLSSGTASAWHRGHFGVFIAPPPLWGPPAVYYRGYYPPPVAYGPGYYGPYRVWIPGHWDSRWTPFGWQRAWIPGYWDYR